MDVRNFIVLLLVVAGCAETSSDSATDSTARQPLVAAVPDLPTPQTDGPAANAHERAMKAKSVDKSPQGPFAERIDWAEARGVERLDSAMLPISERGKLQNVHLPVLAFDDVELLKGALITENQNWYFLAVKSDDGLTMSVRGTRNAWVVPNMDIPEAARKAAENYTLTRTHGVVTLSWRSFGASYSVDLECSKPLDDVRCTRDAFVLDTVEKLKIVGGES